MPAPSHTYTHRGYLGWITDLATRPHTHADWPSMLIDDSLIDDYRQSFKLISQLGFNEVVIWGFYVARDWPLDITSAVSPERARQVERIIDLAHENNLRVYSGLGVYSWGFDKIIAANPHLAPTNPHAMCAHQPEAWRWMQKVTDFVYDRFNIDGVSMQSADQGRCSCPKCASIPDADYHALVNIRTGQYIRANWPDKTLAVNGWGMKFEQPETLTALVDMSRHVDYIIDTHDTSRRTDPAYRKTIIDALHCPFGTLGGLQTEPPQHWNRDAWFLPTTKHVAHHLADLYSEGGRVCEFFFHILANPADELTLHVAGKALMEPLAPWPNHLNAAIESLYQPTSTAARDHLADLMIQAEDAYCSHNPHTCGTISLEPLVSAEPGPPIYLTRYLDVDQLKAYAQTLTSIKDAFHRLEPDFKDTTRIPAMIQCIQTLTGQLHELADKA